MLKILLAIAALMIFALLTGCASAPSGLQLSSNDSPENFEGSWKYEVSCSDIQKGLSQQDNAYVKFKCSNKVNIQTLSEDEEGNIVQLEPPDFFAIDLVSHENLLCGVIVSTAMYHNRVDSSIVVGWVSGSRADLVFSSLFAHWAETGNATLLLKGAGAKWSVTKEIPSSYTWPEAMVNRDASSGSSIIRNTCKDKWEFIRRRDISGIDFESQ